MKDAILKAKNVKELHAELGKVIAEGHGNAKWIPNFSGPNGQSDGVEIYTGTSGNFTTIAKVINTCEA